MSKTYQQRDDAPEWTAKRAYERVRVAVIRMQAKENPTDCMAVVTDQQLRMSLCANGSMPAKLFDRSLKMLHEDGEIAYGGTFVSYPQDAQMAREAIEYVAAADEPDRQFIGRMNSLLSGGAFDRE